MTIEQQLVKRCISGDRKAQKELFEVYAKKMMGVCLRYARTTQEAEDMLQDGFIRVFTHLNTFKFDGPLDAWIRRVVVNASLRHVNKKAFSYESIGIPEYYDAPVVSDAISKLSEQELIVLINKLPIGYKTVFNLYVIEGYSHREISEMLDCGESTSRSQLAKAKRSLQKLIESMYQIAV
jgi:RNA polymerase sigma-70 factor (ECF subfamily)